MVLRSHPLEVRDIVAGDLGSFTQHFYGSTEFHFLNGTLVHVLADERHSVLIEFNIGLTCCVADTITFLPLLELFSLFCIQRWCKLFDAVIPFRPRVLHRIGTEQYLQSIGQLFSPSRLLQASPRFI